MRIEESCPIIVRAILENLEDLYLLGGGATELGSVRAVTMEDAIVDTSVSGLLVPTRLIEALGLRRTQRPWMRAEDGAASVRTYEAVRLTVQDRDCTTEVREIQGDSPVRVGRIPLLALDWVVDPVNQKLIGNPEHGGEWIIEAY